MPLTQRERAARARERRKLRLAAPNAVALAASSTPDAQLDEFAQAIRARLQGYLADLGGIAQVSQARAAQVQMLVAGEIVLAALERDVQALTRTGQLWSLKTRKASPLLAEWVRVRDHVDRLLRAVGVERAPRPPMSLEEATRQVLAQRSGTAGTGATRTDQAPDDTSARHEVARAPVSPGDQAAVKTPASGPEPVEVRPRRLAPQAQVDGGPQG